MDIIYFQPAEKEYHREVRQPKERAKIDGVLKNLGVVGFPAPGARIEKVKGIKEEIYELKIKAFGSEHRFLAGFAPVKSLAGDRILVLLKYIKKKKWRLSRDDIDTAVGRLLRVSAICGD